MIQSHTHNENIIQPTFTCKRILLPIRPHTKCQGINYDQIGLDSQDSLQSTHPILQDTQGWWCRWFCSKGRCEIFSSGFRYPPPKPNRTIQALHKYHTFRIVTLLSRIRSRICFNSWARLSILCRVADMVAPCPTLHQISYTCIYRWIFIPYYK
jgi:hypothetical protein